MRYLPHIYAVCLDCYKERGGGFAVKETENGYACHVCARYVAPKEARVAFVLSTRLTAPRKPEVQ